jgi:hypothetical protein
VEVKSSTGWKKLPFASFGNTKQNFWGSSIENFWSVGEKIVQIVVITL